MKAARWPAIDALVKAAIASVEAMTPAERAEMEREQRESWVRAEAAWPKPKITILPDGTIFYPSYEDYCNG